MRSNGGVFVSLAAAALAAVAGQARGQCFSDRVVASDMASTDLFGAAVSITFNGVSNNLAVGAPRDNNEKGSDAGAVYTFTDSTGPWWQFAKVVAANGAAEDYFGSSLDISGNSMLVAAPGAGSTGRVYLYDRFGPDWVEKAAFTGAAANDGFGYAVALDGNIAVVGAPYNNYNNRSDAGAAYVYERSNGTWTYKVTLAPYHLWHNPGDWFGSSADVDGATVIVGIPNGDAFDASDCGFAQCFVKQDGAWYLSGALYMPDHATGDDAGYAVAIEGDVAVVGAPGKSVDGKAEAGAAYVFRRTGGSWEFEQKLVAYPVYADSRFGTQVAISDGVVAVGAFGNEWVYTFEQAISGEWAQMSRVTDPVSGASKFGAAIAVNDGLLAIGDYQADDSPYSDNGAAFVFELGRDGADVCGGATPVVEGTYVGCTTNATVEGSAGCLDGFQTAPDVFFSYYAEATGTVSFDTFGSAFDTVLSVHEGCPATSQNAIACNDDWSIFEITSYVQAHVVKGHEYVVRVSGVDGAKGGFALHVSELAADACAADFNGDGTVNTIDFISFLNAWNSHDPKGDFNADGTINTIDVIAYLNAFTTGC